MIGYCWEILAETHVKCLIWILTLFSDVCLFVCLFSYSQVALGYTVHSRLCRCSTLCRGAALHSVATALAVTYSLIVSMLHSVALNASLSGYSNCCNILSMLHSVATAVAVIFSQCFTRWLQHLIAWYLGILAEARVAPDTHQSPHSTLCLFTHINEHMMSID